MSWISIQHVFLALCCYNLPFSVNTEKGRLLVFIFFKLILNTAVTENRRKVSSKLLQEVNVLVQTTRPSGLPLHTNLSAMVQSVHFRFRVLLSTNN